MKKIKNIFAFFLAISLTLLLFSSCDKEEEYDFDGYKVVIQNVTGTEIPMQGRYYDFEVPTRGGSEFTWSSALNAGFVLDLVDGDYAVYVNFPDAISPIMDGDAPEVISIVETSQGGVDSEAALFQIDSITPFAALPIVASSDTVEANAGFDLKYKVAPSALDKLYSTFEWSATAGTITDQTNAWETSINFDNADVGYQTLTLTETAMTLTDNSNLVILVKEYCELVNGVDDLVGLHTGWDFDPYYMGLPFEIKKVDDATINVGGLFMLQMNAWGEAWDDTDGSVDFTWNIDGNLVIERQYMGTSDAGYVYWIEGTGTWSNCGTNPVLTFQYSIDDDAGWSYGGNPVSAEITCDGSGAPMKVDFVGIER